MTTKMMINKKAIVIGSGFGGIASALRLNKLGFKVTLVERLDTLGGRARVFQKEGYRHDAGPTVITAPFLFEELYELFDKKSHKSNSNWLWIWRHCIRSQIKQTWL